MKSPNGTTSSLLIPTSGPADWRRLLADPEKHWRTGYSARSLAYGWEEARGFPPEVKSSLARSGVPALEAAEMLIGIPEHQVARPGGRRPSQNDVWVLARGAGQLISMAVEGKVSEPFGPTLGEWLKEASPGKLERLAFIAACLGLEQPIPEDIRYQLLHRTASAVIEARRFGAPHAVVLVHSFSQSHEWLPDYQRFHQLFGAAGDAESIHACGSSNGTALYAGWVTGEARFLSA